MAALFNLMEKLYRGNLKSEIKTHIVMFSLKLKRSLFIINFNPLPNDLKLLTCFFYSPEEAKKDP